MTRFLHLWPLTGSGRHSSLLMALAFLTACQSLPPETEAPDHSTETTSAVSIPAETISTISPEQLLIELPEVHTDIWSRIRAGLRLQEHYELEEVQYWLETYRGNQRLFDLVAQRAEPFFFYIVEEVEKAGLPLELALLPIVESTFDPNAYSGEHAVGLWQFLSTTGRSFGLQQDWWYDGRRDPHASTAAALSYLQRLHGQFQDNWLLAVAAYNTGSPNMRRAIRRSQQTDSEAVDFWTLPLARETRSHVPKLLALSAIVADPVAYDIELPEIANSNPLTRLEVGAQIDLTQAASLAGMDYDELRYYNNGYRQWATHPDTPQWLYLPTNNAEQLRTALAQLPADELVTWDRYEIQSGDTLGAIAVKLGTSVDVLRVVNRLGSDRIIAGRSLLIPRGLNRRSDLTQLASMAPVQDAPPAIPDSYTIRRGDNLWSIARRYQLRSSDIAEHNGFAIDALLMPGQEIDLSFAVTATTAMAESTGIGRAYYRVRSGDTLARIAARHKLSVAELLEWNEFSSNEIIFPDQQIRIRAPQSTLE